MSLFSRLFGASPTQKPDAEPEIYKGFRIFAEPIKAAGGFRVGARIEKEIGGQHRSHNLIRADVCESEDTAREVSTRKAKALIDQRDDALFD
jgi:hypothetical protein